MQYLTCFMNFYVKTKAERGSPPGSATKVFGYFLKLFRFGLLTPRVISPAVRAIIASARCEKAAYLNVSMYILPLVISCLVWALVTDKVIIIHHIACCNRECFSFISITRPVERSVTVNIKSDSARMHHINALIRAAKVIVVIVPEERRLNVSLLLPSVKFAAVHLCGTCPSDCLQYPY